MAMTPERKVKQRVVAELKRLGCYYFYPVTGGYGSSGVPDIVGCVKGRFFAIECKAGSNMPTALQAKNMEEIRKRSGFVLVIRETGFDQAIEMFEQWVANAS